MRRPSEPSGGVDANAIGADARSQDVELRWDGDGGDLLDAGEQSRADDQASPDDRVPPISRVASASRPMVRLKVAHSVGIGGIGAVRRAGRPDRAAAQGAGEQLQLPGGRAGRPSAAGSLALMARSPRPTQETSISSERARRHRKQRPSMMQSAYRVWPAKTVRCRWREDRDAGGAAKIISILDDRFEHDHQRNGGDGEIDALDAQRQISRGHAEEDADDAAPKFARRSARRTS